MIGFLQGEVIFSDGSEVIILTSAGIGHQIYYNSILAEGNKVSLYISHVVKETSEELFGFNSLRDKKLFEILTSVKGVGPKTAYILIASIGAKQVVNSILLENKEILKKAPGIGQKAASQIILDLSNKIQKINMYSNRSKAPIRQDGGNIDTEKLQVELSFDEISSSALDESGVDETILLNDTILACKELGFKEDKVLPLAQKILLNNQVKKAEQLVHLVLKEV